MRRFDDLRYLPCVRAGTLCIEAASAELLYFRGEARRPRNESGDAAAAVLDLESAVAASNEPAQTHRALGYLHRDHGYKDAARDAWQRYLERAPQAPDAALIQQSLMEI